MPASVILCQRPSKVTVGFGPELAQDFDLLFAAAAAILEIFAEGFIFHRVPADADAEAQTAAAQDIERGGLLGDQDGLTLRQDDDAGDTTRFSW